MNAQQSATSRRIATVISDNQFILALIAFIASVIVFGR